MSESVKSKIRDKTWDRARQVVWEQCSHEFYWDKRSGTHHQVKHEVQFQVWNEIWWCILRTIKIEKQIKETIRPVSKWPMITEIECHTQHRSSSTDPHWSDLRIGRWGDYERDI